MMAKYIDTELFIKALKQSSELTGRYADAVRVFEVCIKLMKPADVVEVKHGEWIERDSDYDTYYDCSVCGESFVFIEGSPVDNLYYYCPHCGAKMEGEHNEK